MQLNSEIFGKAQRKEIDTRKGYYGKRKKELLDFYLSTDNLVFYFYQCNKHELKELLKRKSIIMMKSKKKVACVNQTILQQNYGLMEE